jgi:aminoglycoside 6'-N-acetyltransferase
LRPTISFRRVTRADFSLIATWLAEPHVARWWNHEHTAEAIERDFGDSVDGAEPNEDYLAVLEDKPLGLLQYCRYADYPEHLDELSTVLRVPDGAVSIDYLIGDPTQTGQGRGTAMIRAFTDRIWHTDPMATCVLVPVASANRASWRALRRAGFQLAARGELQPDNPIDDRSHEILRLDRPTQQRPGSTNIN